MIGIDVIKRDPCTKTQTKMAIYLAAMVKESATSDTVYTMRINEFLKMVNENNAPGGSSYNTVKKNLSDLRMRGLDIQITTVNEEIKVISIPFISKYKYISKRGIIDFKLDDEAINFYSNNNYCSTMFDVDMAMRMHGKYSILLYDFLLFWQKAKAVVCTTDKLKKVLSVPQKRYERTNSFFKWCIYPAIEEINNKTNIKIEMVPLKTYRREIQEVWFHILVNTNTTMVAALVETGLAERVAKKIAKDYSGKRIKGNFELTKQAKIAGFVKNFPEFLVKAIKDDYAHIESDTF
jgi:plasmid replication initiation protein